MINLYLRKRKRLLKSLILAGSLFVLLFFFYSLFRFLAFRLFQYDLFSHEVVVLAAAMVIVFLAYKPLEYLVLLFFRDVLFRSHVRDHSMLSQLARTLSGVLDRKELANLIVNTFGEALHFRAASVLLYEKAEGVYRIISAYGLKPSAWQKITLSPNGLLMELLRTHKVPLERERLMHSFSWQEANQLTHDFEQLHASWVIPLVFQNDLIGSINLMPKVAAKSFSTPESKSFFEFALDAAGAFRNANLFHELAQSNQELMKIQSSLLHSTQHSAIARLATGIAHEIHNPLTIISGKAQIMLLKRGQIAYDAQVEDVLKTIVKQTKRAADITRKLLMFSESHKSAKELIELETVVNDTIALLSYQVSLDQIQVIKRFEQPIPKWFGNVVELREAFLNLFLNAVQAIGTQGVVRVTLRHRERERVIELKISDSGPGIKPEHQAQVFHPFFTTRQGASGLGLFVTQQIIHGYHGSMRVESKPGEGATFLVELPSEQLPESPEVKETELVHARAAAKETNVPLTAEKQLLKFIESPK